MLPVETEFSQLCRQVFDAEPFVDHFARILNTPNRRVVGGYSSSNQLVGVCVYSTGFYPDVKLGTALGFIDLIAVTQTARSQGIGSLLLANAEEDLRSSGCSTARVGANSPYYLWPGVDVRYLPALAFFHKSGYRQSGMALSLAVPEDINRFDVRPYERKLLTQQISIRKANAEDCEWLKRDLRSKWTSSWIDQVLAAVSPRTIASNFGDSGLYVACREERCVGFCAWGVNRPNQVGPLGTDPQCRGRGVGRVLLLRCLEDQVARGIAPIELSWAGPLGFFSRHFGATTSRAMVTLGKALLKGHVV